MTEQSGKDPGAVLSTLVADHDEQLRTTLTGWLSDEGIKALAVPDGQEALRQLQTQDFDSALVDIEMSGVNGFDILRYIRKTSPRTVVIMMGVNDVTLGIEALKLGASDYLTRPVDLQQIVPVIKAALQKRNQEEQFKELQAEHTNQLLKDLQNPIEGLRQSISYLLQGMAGPLADHQKEIMGYMTGSMDKVIDLIGDMMDLTKLEGGRIKLNKGYGSLADAGSRVVADFQPVIHTNKQTLDFYNEPDIPMIEFDPVKIELAFLYVIDFLTKITPPKGSIVVHALKKKISFEEGKKPSDHIVADFYSSGTAISEKEISKLFDQYRNVVNDTGERQSGWLRLIICQRIIDAHNGKIWAKHEKGKGIIVSFALPVH